MKTEFQRYFSSFCATLALIALPMAGHAVPITYNIGAGSAPGFSASWIHAGTTQMGSTGYYANGIKTSVTGSLTLDMDLLTASGQVNGTGDFGLGSDNWTLTFTGASQDTVLFVDGNVDLLSLSYELTGDSSPSSSGIFYFANRDFNGGSVSDGPNYIDDNVLYLWGNNWVNENGASDRDTFNGTPLGLDLYGEVSEPGVVALLAMGLLGMGFRDRFNLHSKSA